MAVATEKRNVVLGVTGSIAAYKSAELVRTLISRGYAVRVVMTDSAQKFIGKATFETLSGYPVLTSFWDEDSTTGVAHIEYGQWADAVVIAPASAETIAKLATGSAADPLSAVVLATKAPVVIAPAMNAGMYENPATQENIERLKKFGVTFVGPDDGALACGQHGRGRMAEPWDIFYVVRKALSVQDLEGQRIVITTGMTRDSMDTMRDETQISSTKLGVEIAREAYRRGAEVVLIHGGQRPKVPQDIKCVEASINKDLKEAIVRETKAGDKTTMVVLAGLSNQFRIKKEAEGLSFEASVDVLDELGEVRGANSKLPLIITFVAGIGESEELFHKGRQLIADTPMDILVGKFAETRVDLESNELWLIDHAGKETQISTTYKSRVATQLFDVAMRIM